MADLLLDRLLDYPRERAGLAAVSALSAGQWSFLNWSELMVRVRRQAGALTERGERRLWRSGGVEQVIGELALQFSGEIGVWGQGTRLPEPTPDDVGRLVRMRQDVRPRDPVTVRGGRALDHSEVADIAARLSTRLGLGAKGVPLRVVCTSAEALQVLTWACVWGGHSIIVSDGPLAAVSAPDVWVCDPAGINAVVGCKRLFVVGTVPAEALALQRRGVEVSAWTA